MSPSCGGAQRDGADCRLPYADADLRVISEAGTIVGTARASATGRYSVALPAGRYRLQVVTSVRLTRCPVHEVVVGSSGHAIVDIDCDSGMR